MEGSYLMSNMLRRCNFKHSLGFASWLMLLNIIVLSILPKLPINTIHNVPQQPSPSQIKFTKNASIIVYLTIPKVNNVYLTVKVVFLIWVFANKIMISDLGLCDSFDEDDIEQLEAELEGIDGPNLRNFQMLQQEQPILPFSCIDIIRGLLDQGKDVRLVGRDNQSGLKAFLYVLLLLGAEQRRSYPHLNTLIREQFYKPNIFRDQSKVSASDESRAMLDKCLQYFQEVGEGVRIEEYLLREPLFEQACLIMLNNSLEEGEGPQLQQLARKFNIDLKAVGPEMSGQCYHLGIGSTYQIIREQDYFFLAVGEAKDDLSQSKLQLQSIRSGESGLHLIVAPQASDQSTPKFKNSEVKFRKKSHKNSFGGDLEIVQYRDLLHLQTQKLTMNNAKVLSEYFEVNEVESCAQQLDQKFKKKNSFQDIIDSQKVEMKVEMKGSTTLPPQQHLQRRNRKISSSEIIEYRDFNPKKEESNKKVNEPLEQEEEQDHHKPHSYNSLVVVNDSPINAAPLNARMRTSLMQQNLQRIQQRQSSQRQSTHPQQQSQHSEQRQGVAQSDSHMKLKDRKYSYFTQQLASKKAKKAREVDSGNYVFRIPKNMHKNSEVILPSGNDNEHIRQRFQENPLRFSQLNAPSESSVHQSFQQAKRAQNRNLRLSSSLYSYQIRSQPMNWYKKQIIYYLDNGHKEVQVINRNIIHPVQVIPPREGLAIRESIDSGRVRAMKNSNNFTAAYQPSQTSNTVVNPYELNQTSFLKNRIQSMANLDPFQPDREQTKSAVFSTCRSLRNIASPSKISFNYLPPQQKSQNDTSLTVNRATVQYIPNTPVSPSSPKTLQFRHPLPRQGMQVPFSPQSRPQTFSGFMVGPNASVELRLGRK